MGASHQTDRACPTDADLVGFADGCAPASEAARIEAHLDGCAACRALLQAFARATTDGDRDGPVASAARVAPRYELGEELGRGSQGATHRAWDRELGRAVALKFVHAADDAARRQFRDEARALAQLVHPHVLEIYDVDVSQDPWVLAMPVCEGGTLARAAATGLPWRRTLELFRDVAAALAAIHRENLLHRDVKPSNLFLTADGTVKVGDFGLASPIEGRRSAGAAGRRRADRTSRTCGTPAYLAPELLAGDRHTRASDQFAMFVSMLELLTGRAADDPARWRRSDVPRWLQRVVDRGLSPTPGDRFADLEAVRVALHRAPSRSARAAGVVLVASGAVALAWWPGRIPADEPACDARDPWTTADRDGMRGALARSGHPDAESRTGEITAALDGFARRWTELDAEACATGTIAARRCLDRRREHVAAVVHGVGQLPMTARAVDRLSRTLPEILGLDECGRIPSDGPQGAGESPARAAVATRVHLAHTRELLIGYAAALPDYEALLDDPEISAFPDLAAENLRRATSARLVLGRIDLGTATAAFERAEATAAAGDDPAVASRVLIDRANAAGAAGDPSEARRLLRFSASHLARAGNPAPESIRVAILEAELAVFLDSPEAALTQATSAWDAARAIGCDALAERAQLVVARAALEQGQPARAAAILEELQRATVAALGDDGHELVEIELSLGQALISAARPSAAREIYERVAGRLAASQPDSDNLAFALAGLAAARAQGGDLDGAAEAAERSATIYRIHGDAMGEAMVEITAAEIAHRDGRRSDALAALARGRAIYEAHLGVDHPNLAQIRELAVEFAAAP